MELKVSQAIEYTKKLIRKFSDVRFSSQVIFLILVILVFWSGVRSIQQNYQLQKQINQINQQNLILKLQNSNIALLNNYYKSSQYQEIIARENLGLGYSGETEILVPDTIALKYDPNPVSANSKKKIATNNSNFAEWMNFFFGKHN
ncbi:MAG: septum formation initiator family protein [Patescibacteria group bacterium]|jgi:cell division protein FtsB|nr:septum formation initiator family protein [Patescibacteria group bacterium]